MKSSQPGNNIGTPIRIEDPNQFVPLNTDPTEVQDKRNRVSWNIITSNKLKYAVFKYLIVCDAWNRY